MRISVRPYVQCSIDRGAHASILRSICLICIYAFSNSCVNICIHLHVNLWVWNWNKCSLILKLHYTIGCTNDDYNNSDSEDDNESDDDHGDYDKDDNNSENDNNLMTTIMTLVLMMIITDMVMIICYYVQCYVTYLYSLLTIVVCEFNDYLAISKAFLGNISSHLIWHEKLCSVLRRNGLS